MLNLDGTKRVLDTPELTRRVALGLGAGALIAAGTSQAALSVPEDPLDANLVYRKLQYRTDSGLVFWWLQGPYYGLIDQTLTPLWAINMGSIQKVTHHPDGTFEVKQLEIAFRTDIDTGKRLTEFHNPITNETVPVQFAPVGPATMTYSRDNIPKMSTELGGAKLEYTRYPSSTFTVGETLFLRQRSATRVMTAGAGPDRIINELSTISGSLKQLHDPAIACADARVESTDVTGWGRWLNMGNHPGTMTLRAIGIKLKRFDDFPESWREMLHEAAPEIAADPIGALDRPQAVYKN